MYRNFTINETAKLFEVSRETVYNWVISGKLEATHGGYYYNWEIKEEAIRNFAFCHKKYHDVIAKNLGPEVSPDLLQVIESSFKPLAKRLIERIKEKKAKSMNSEEGV